MTKTRWLVVLAVLVLCVLARATIAVGAAQPEGTTWQELAARKPPPPSEVTVAVMPFSVPKGGGERTVEKL